MRSYIIIKTLALSFGAVSVVARSLPERPSELNHAARGYGSSNPHQSNLENAGVEADTAMSKASTVLDTVTNDVDDLAQHLQSFVKISEGLLDGKVYTSTYSIPADPTLSKRGTPFPKRDDDLSGAHCLTACATPSDLPQPSPADCTDLYNWLYSMPGGFTVGPSQTAHFKSKTCGSVFTNNTPETVTYNYWDLGGATQYLNGFCILRNMATYGACKFGDAKTDIDNAASVVLVHPSYFGE